MTSRLATLAACAWLIAGCYLAHERDADAAPAARDTAPATRDTAPAASLAGLRVELACTGAHTSDACAAIADRRSAVLVGAEGARYDVTLRVRGAVETITCAGGAQSGFVSVGGTIDPIGYNAYALEVGSPAQTFWLNAGTSNVRHCFALDYELVVPVDSGSTVTLVGDPRDGVEIIDIDARGAPLVVPGVQPAPASFDGQFVQVDVVAITPR